MPWQCNTTGNVNDLKLTLEAMQEGALGIVSHGALLGGSKVESARTRRAIQSVKKRAAQGDDVPLHPDYERLPEAGGHAHNAGAAWGQDQVRAVANMHAC